MLGHMADMTTVDNELELLHVIFATELFLTIGNRLLTISPILLPGKYSNKSIHYFSRFLSMTGH